MKKTILPFVACLFTSTMFGQVTVYNGEDMGAGMWESFLTDAVEVENPSKDGLNTSDKCLRISRIKNTDPWAGARAPHLSITNITDYGKITMMVKKAEAATVRLEIQTEGETRKEFLAAEYSSAALDTWQKLEFNLPANSLGNEPIAIILASIHYTDTRADEDYFDQYMYLDEIKLEPKTTEIAFDGETRGLDMWEGFLTDIAIVDNTDKDAINGSDKCLQIMRRKDMDDWAGARAPRFKVTNLNEYKKISLMIKKQVAGPVRLELQTRDESTKEFLVADYPAEAINKWTKLEFAIPDNALQGQPLSIILMSPHLTNTREDPNFTDQLIFVDEMYLSNEGGSSISVPVSNNARIILSNVYNLTGKKVCSFGADTEIDLTGLSKGLYIVEQIDENGVANSRKVINE